MDLIEKHTPIKGHVHYYKTHLNENYKKEGADFLC